MPEPEVHWGTCSSHCTSKGGGTAMREAKLSIMKQKECQQLGKAMGIDTKTEMCAALKNNDSIPYVTYKKGGGGKFEKVEESDDDLIYYGGSDACQGDSGGPL